MADTYEKDLGQKSSLTTSDFIRVVGSDNVSYKQSVANVAEVVNSALTTIKNVRVSSSSPASIKSPTASGSYAAFIVMGFAQGIGSVMLGIKCSGSTFSVVDLTTGNAFSNSYLTFSYAPTTAILTINSSISSNSSLTVICS